MLIKKETIIIKILIRTINYSLFIWINKVCKLIKKYEFDELMELYILSRFRLENACLFDKCYTIIIELVIDFDYTINFFYYVGPEFYDRIKYL